MNPHIIKDHGFEGTAVTLCDIIYHATVNYISQHTTYLKYWQCSSSCYTFRYSAYEGIPQKEKYDLYTVEYLEVIFLTLLNLLNKTCYV